MRTTAEKWDACHNPQAHAVDSFMDLFARKLPDGDVEVDTDVVARLSCFKAQGGPGTDEATIGAECALLEQQLA